MINKKAFNCRLNRMKDAYPDERPLIEAIQNEFNKKVELISPNTKKALLTFPEQFTQEIRTSSENWTTMLHVWADNQLTDLLRIDPRNLTAKNSNGDCVLKVLIMAALGAFTEQINYELIETILKTPMQFTELTKPGDPESSIPGNVWYERDINGKSVIEFLYNFANADDEFSGREPDERLIGMINHYAEKALDTEILPDIAITKIDEQAAQDEIEETDEALDNTLETDPENIETADEESGEPIDDDTGDVVNTEEPAKSQVPESSVGEEGNDDSKNMLNILSTLIKLGRCFS